MNSDTVAPNDTSSGAPSLVLDALRGRLRLRRGQMVEVRTAEEIRATLDERGCLDNLPFMPEMLPMCGKRFRVFRRAQLICVEGIGWGQRQPNTVVLEGLRCDGSAHGGCQRACLILWNERWLRKVDDADAPEVGHTAEHDEPILLQNTQDGPRFFCQSTELKHTTSHCSGVRVPQVFVNAVNGNIGPGDLATRVLDVLGGTLKRVFSRARAAGRGTPTASLNLQPGELVEVRSFAEIQSTLDSRWRNRGLYFEDSMRAFCGKRFTVERRVERIVLETTGEMKTLRDTVALKDVTCPACPRANVLYWREIWLRRV